MTKPSDTVQAVLTENTGEIAKHQYVVVVDCGIFKRGKLYEKGAKIELDTDTANRFIELGEIEKCN